MLDRLGISAEEFDEKLTRASTTAQRQNLVLETLANSGLANVSLQYKQANQSQKAYADAQYDLNQKLYELAQQLEPIVAQAIASITNVLTENAGTVEKVVNILRIWCK